MAAQSGILGLGTFGSVATVSVGAAVVAGGLYLGGVFDPAPAENVAVVAPDPEPSPQTPPVEPEPKSDEAVEAPAAAPEDETTASVPEPEPVPDPQPTPEPEQEEAMVALDAPGFDVVRASPDGSTLVAGTAPAGALITVLLDNMDFDSVSVDGSGQFVMFLTLEPSQSPRVLSLRAEKGEQVSLSDEEIILAPAPVQTSKAESTAPSTVEEPVETVVAKSPAEAEPEAESTETTVVAVLDQPETVPEAIDETQNQTSSATVEETAETVSDEDVAAPPENEAVAAETTNQTTDVAENQTVETVETPQVEETAEVATTTVVPEPVVAEPDAPQTTAAAPAAPQSPPSAPSVASSSDVQSAPVAVLRSTRDGVELLQPGASDEPVPSQDLALDTISYSELGEIQLSGRSAVSSTIRVYLDNARVADIASDANGRWRGVLQGIDPGVYTMRLDAVDADGRVMSRLETPFKREEPGKLVAGTGQGAEQSLIQAVTVQTGDTLWAISRERYGEGLLYVRLFEANRDQIRDPDLIYPGQVFAIPN